MHALIAQWRKQEKRVIANGDWSNHLHDCIAQLEAALAAALAPVVPEETYDAVAEMRLLYKKEEA